MTDDSARTNDTMRSYSKDEQLISAQRKLIAHHAARLLVKQGYDKTSVREIADACSMPVGTLYRYIGSKEDILYLVIYYGGMEKFEPVETDGLSVTQQLRQSMERLYLMADDQQDMVLFAFHETRNLKQEARKWLYELIEYLVSSFEALLQKGCDSGEFKIPDVKICAYNIVSNSFMWGLHRWYLGKYFTIGEYTDKQIETVLSAIRAD